MFGNSDCDHLRKTLGDTLRIYTSIAVSTKTNTNPNPYRRRCPDPNARIQKTEDLQIKTGNTKLRLQKI